MPLTLRFHSFLRYFVFWQVRIHTHKNNTSYYEMRCYGGTIAEGNTGWLIRLDMLDRDVAILRRETARSPQK